MNVANKKIQLKDPTTYSRMITMKAQEMSEDITDIVETVKPDILSVGFTTDLWTSRAGQLILLTNPGNFIGTLLTSNHFLRNTQG